MENIMLDEKKKNIKLIDFGLSNIYKADEPLRTHCGSPEYAAPELFVVGKTYGPEIDIWSLGIITYAIVIGKLPFFTPYNDEYQRQRMLQQIQKGLSAYHDREMQILTPECRNLLHQVLEPKPERRIPLSEIEIHPWLTKNGKYPFSPYVAPPKDKQMRHQSTSELAIMTGIKRMMVEETVKEHKADELSAMFNMLMDKKRKLRGFFDIDHTYRKTRHDRDGRSRSRDREKINVKTPDSHKGKEIKGKALKKGIGKPKVNNVTRPSSFITPIDGTTKPDATKKHITLDVGPKIGSDSSLTDKAPALALAQAPPPYHQASHNVPSSITSSTCRPHHNAPKSVNVLNPHPHSILTVPPPSVTTATAADTAVLSHQLHHQHHHHQPTSSELPANKHTPPTVANTSTVLQSNGPVTRIPFSQRCVPPAKLNMTLDLSVTHTPRKVVAPKDVPSESESKEQTPGQTTGTAAVGIAATSGVRPKISTSPKEVKESKIPVLSPSRKDILKILCSPTRSMDGSKRPLRPSTLQYIRTSLEKVRKRIPSSSDNHKEKEGDGIECKDCDVDDCDTKELLAPKATPEDSMIDSYSTSSSDGDGGPNNICGRKVQIQATVEEIPMQCKASMLNASDDEKLQHVLLGKAHKECVIKFSPEESGIIQKNSVDEGGDSSVESPSRKTVTISSEVTQQSQMLTCDVKQKDFDKLQTVKQLSFELDHNYDSSTSQLSKSSQNSVGMCPHSHVKHNLLTGSGSSLPMRFQHKLKPTDLAHLCTTLPISGSEPVSVGSVASKEVQDEQPLSTSLSNPSKLDNTHHLSCRACGLSPDSPTYFEKHVRFSHTGAHALDIFTSPDDMPSPPLGAFWRPKTGFSSDSPNQGSPSHNMGILGCMYCFPTVGADTPRVPIQLPIASMEVFNDPDILNEEAQKELTLLESPDKCHKTTVHIPINSDGCSKTVDKQPVKQSSPDKSFQRTATCSKNTSLHINTVEAVYTPVPDTSLRLEPVGGSSESLDERVQGDGCTTKSEDQFTNNSSPQVCPSPPIVSVQEKKKCQDSLCDFNKPTQVAKSSVRAATKQVMSLLHWERSNSTPSCTEIGRNEQGDNNKVCSGLQCLPNQQKKNERNKFLRQYDSKTKQLSWRQGLSHLLRKSRTPSANNNITSSSVNTTNTSNISKVNSVSSSVHDIGRNSRCNSIDDKEEYYQQMDMKWTAAPTDAMIPKTVSLELHSSPVPSNYPTKNNQLFDIKSSHEKIASDVTLTHIEILACTECAKTGEKSSNKNEKPKVTKNGTSPKKPVIIPNSTRKSSAKSKTQPSKV